MRTREEKAAQVDAALRARFFPFIPKIENANRTNWKAEQHDIDRLSRALAAYTLVGICHIEDADAAQAVTDGEQDGGIDAFYFDKANNRLVIVQSKYHRQGNSPAQDDVLKTLNGIRKLRDHEYDGFNEFYHRRFEELESAFDTIGVHVVIAIAFLGDTLNEHAQGDLEKYRRELEEDGADMHWRAVALDCLCEWLLAEQTPQSVTATLTLENWCKVTAPRTVYYGQISARELAALVVREGTGLFERNVRYYLGSSEVNKAIAKTVTHAPADLFYLNNGLTAIAQRIRKSPGTRARCRVELQGVSIVNGAQTAGAIATAGNISPDAKLLLTIIEVGEGQEYIGVGITRARNSQNLVRNLDFAAADANQERLKRELATMRISYHYRPSADAYDRKEDSFNIEEAALALASLGFPVMTNAQVRDLETRGKRVQNGVNFAVTASHQKGILTDRESSEYKQLFTKSLTGIHLYRLVRIYRFVDAILAESGRTESTYSRRSFFTHGRYLLMAFVAQSVPGVLSHPALSLQEEDQVLLSRSIDDLSEEIYGHARLMQREQAARGFVSFFGSLARVQPLVDRIYDARALLQTLTGANGNNTSTKTL